MSRSVPKVRTRRPPAPSRAVAPSCSKSADAIPSSSTHFIPLHNHLLPNPTKPIPHNDDSHDYDVFPAVHTEAKEAVQVPTILPAPVPDDSPVLSGDSTNEFYPIFDQEHDEGLEDLAQMEGIWQHSLQSCEESPTPPPCSCHGMPIGACPQFMANLVDCIVRCNAV